MAKWEEKYAKSPVYSLNKFIQDKLVEMEFIDMSDYVSDFNGSPNFALPFFVPGQELPELETVYDDAAFLHLAYSVYSVSHRYSPDEPYLMCGQVSYSFYHDDVDILMAMSDYVSDLMGREDWTANDINYHFRSDSSYPFEFKTVYVLTTAGPAPSGDEGGRYSFMIVLKYDVTYEGINRNYSMSLDEDNTVYINQGMR